MNLTLPDLIVTTEDLTVDPAECLRLAEDVHVLQMRVDACEYEQGKPSYTCEAVVQLGHLARTALPALARRTLVAERFKTWVHAFLDEQGIPADPDPEEAKRTGCRIGCRMRHVFAALNDAENNRAALHALLTAEFGTADPAELPRLFDQRRELYQRLLTAVRKHRDALAGDDAVFDRELYRALPEGCPQEESRNG